jgi:phosphoglycerate dehydrogenase-like enzyme
VSQYCEHDVTTRTVRVLSTMAFPDRWLDWLGGVSPQLAITQITAATAGEVPPDAWREVEVLYSGAAYPDPAIAPNLRWVQLDTAGADGVLDTPLWRSDVAITTLRGVGPPTAAEYALMMVLSLAHHLPTMLDGQRRRYWPSADDRWQQLMPRELRGATLGVVGYGAIGREIGRLARAFGMTVLGLRQGATATAAYSLPPIGEARDAEPDRLFGPDGLHEMLARCDYVVLAVPSTPATFQLMDEAAFRAMRPSAMLVNVARGAVVDEQALIRALREQRIAGAALDVFETEPLPDHSPLWTMDNVIVTPHVAGLTPHYHERIMDLFAQNLRRYLVGEPLLNQVPRDRHY